MSYIQLSLAIICEVVATTFLKESQGFTRVIPSIVTVVGYGLAFYFLSQTLKTIPTGVAYAIWSGAGVVLITTVAWLFQGQKLDAAALVGMGLIVAGVVVLNTLSRTAAS